MTVMRYKAAAQKFRRIAGLDDPVPAAVVVEPSSEDVAAVIDPASEDASAAAVEPLDADNPDGISAGGGRGVVDHLGAGATGYGRVRLRCGRNEIRDKTI